MAYRPTTWSETPGANRSSLASTRSANGSVASAQSVAAISPAASPRISPGTVRTWIHKTCVPSGARLGSTAVVWPTIRSGLSGRSPARLCW